MTVNRSPRYPSIDLREAISLAIKLYDKEGRAAVKEDVAVSHFGYKGLNGASSKVLSALRKYGLVEDVPGGVKLSQDAIVLAAHRNDPGNNDYREVIKRAVGRVELFNTLSTEFGTQASEQNLVAQLTIRGFSSEGAVKAARAYRATMELVGSDFSTSLNQEEVRQNKEIESETEVSPPSRDIPAAHKTQHQTVLPDGMRREIITLDEGDVVINFPDNLSPESFGDLKDHLDLFIKKMLRRTQARSEQL
jgi:hypothetical protein